MKGFKSLGTVAPNALDDVDDSAMILFTVNTDGSHPRNGGRPIRARQVKLYRFPHAAIEDAANTDHLWVATAVGENAFK